MEELILKSVAPVIQTVAIAVTAYYASRGLHAWRDQTLGKRKIEVAEEALVAAYKVRDGLAHVRNPGGFGNEGRSRERPADESENIARLRDSYFVPLERLQALRDDFAEFQKALLLSQVHFGPEAGKPFMSILAARWRVIVAARMLMTTAGQGRLDHNKREEWEGRIWAGASEPDETAEEVDRAVRAIEELFRPHLKAGARGNGRWQRLRKYLSHTD